MNVFHIGILIKNCKHNLPNEVGCGVITHSPALCSGAINSVKPLGTPRKEKNVCKNYKTTCFYIPELFVPNCSLINPMHIKVRKYY